ncbi:MAG TPA: hypothetical protein VFG50_06900 [Rhodothermales bacterium]|nr:hypothetical protein [Rhodothermales bacterium]
MQERHHSPSPFGGQSLSDRTTLHPLVEPTLFYDPPYERPLEDEFAWHLVKYLSPASALEYQPEVETPGGKFWIDFVVELGSRRIGFECGDLSDLDDPDEAALRDALIVGTGGVDALYRLRGKDVLHRLHDCLLVIARWEPELFSTRGHVNLNTLASPEARSSRIPRPSDTEARLAYPSAPLSDEYEGEAFEWPSDAPEDLVVRRFAREHAAGWIKPFDCALSFYGITPEALGARWARSA